MNILIPIDFSPNSKNAIRYALNLFKTKPCHFYILFANVDGFEFQKRPVYKMGTNILVEKETIPIESKLNLLVKELESKVSETEQHRFTALHEKETFLESIRKHIHTDKIELIVMGSKGASQLKEFFMGSHAGDVITKIECDVLVVPERASFKSYENIVFATDFTLDYSKKIFKNLANLITASKAKLHILHIWQKGKDLTSEQQNKKEILMKLFSEFLPNEISFHSIKHRKVEDAIRIFAQSIKAELVTMVSKDHKFLHRQFMDTTVEEVSFETKIPLLSLQT